MTADNRTLTVAEQSVPGGAASPGPLRLLFVKQDLAWPRTSGHDVHCYYMMKGLAGLGHEISLATLVPAKPEAVAGLPLTHRRSFAGADAAGGDCPPSLLSPWQGRFASYWGIEESHVREVGRLAREWRADAIVVDGLNVLPYLGAVHGAYRIWFAADEWIWHHLSQFRLTDRNSWGNLREAAVKGLYERAYAPLLDRVWVVSEADRRAMGWVTGLKGIDVLPNGVDSDHYHPGDEPRLPNSCVFWGRLDFGPNVQALQWFCRKVWPRLRGQAPDARLTIFGFNPTDPVRALAGRDGVTLIPDQLDIRAGIRQHQVVVLPFVSGGGVKSKLLEAFSLGKAVVGTPRSCNGLFGGPSPPLIQARGPRQWVRAVRALWQDMREQDRLGAAARRWIVAHHTWEAAARVALDGIAQTRAAGRPVGERAGDGVAPVGPKGHA
jgi:glycosyltransferase involved in cell wall biosynthesis